MNIECNIGDKVQARAWDHNRELSEIIETQVVMKRPERVTIIWKHGWTSRDHKGLHLWEVYCNSDHADGIARSGHIMKVIKPLEPGDKVRAKIWKGGYDPHAKIYDVKVLKIEREQLLVNWSEGGHWWISRKISKGSAFGHLVFEKSKAPPKKPSVSPFMDDPYGKGPEGETMGPSGLKWL